MTDETTGQRIPMLNDEGARVAAQWANEHFRDAPVSKIAGALDDLAARINAVILEAEARGYARGRRDFENRIDTPNPQPPGEQYQ